MARNPYIRRTAQEQAHIRIENLGITLGGIEIVKNFSLEIKPGQFVCILGPSGCGKSTVMNAIAGFLAPTTGRIRLNEREIRGPGAERGIVFQSTECLFPWLTVRENIEYGPRARGVPKARRREAAEYYIRLVALEHASDRFPHQISGGMQQRAQIARVLVNEPSVILMDEPFGALDAQTRGVMQAELSRIWEATKATIVFITHDIGESILLSDMVVTMTAGPRASIRSVTQVPLDRPRDLTAASEVTLFRKLRSEIEAEVGAALGHNPSAAPEPVHHGGLA